MSGDFLDNLTLRVAQPDSLALQPRLASRFEQPAPLNDSPLFDDPHLDDEVDDGEDVEIARILPSEQRSEQKPETSEAVPNADEPTAPRLIAESAPTINPIQPTAGEQPQHPTMQPAEDFAGRLDAITRRLDRLSSLSPNAAGSIPAQPAASTPAPFIAGTDEPTPIEHHHHHRHQHLEMSTDTAITPQPEHAGQQPVSVQSDRVLPIPEITADTDVAEGITLADRQQQRENPEQALVPQIAVQSQSNSDPPAPLADESAVPQIIVGSTEAGRPPETTVKVTIGRIEVRAVPQTAATEPIRRRSPNPSIMSLDDYMRRRAGGRR